MQPDKRRSIKNYFYVAKKIRIDQRESDSSPIDSLPSPSSHSSFQSSNPQSSSPFGSQSIPSLSFRSPEISIHLPSLFQSPEILVRSPPSSSTFQSISSSCRSPEIPIRSPSSSTVQSILSSSFQLSENPVRSSLSSSSDILNQIYLPLIDCILVELNDRFSCKTLSLLKSISTVYPESENFLDAEAVDDFCRHIDIHPNLVKNEFVVIKPMLQSKTIINVIDFLNELIPFSSAFPETFRMVKSAITMPISQVTCERSFSKLRIIKNYLRSTMTDQRLNDLTIMAIEREIPMDFEQVIDKFSISHKNSRILLR